MATKFSANSGLTDTIAHHRAFPAICALWFAGLFGIGMLIIPIGVLESIAIGTGLASVIPQAAPPLGGTARMLFALLAAGTGLALGLVLAKRIVAQIISGSITPTLDAGPHEVRRGWDDDDRVVPLVRKPINASEELGSDSLDDPVGLLKDLPVDGEPERSDPVFPPFEIEEAAGVDAPSETESDERANFSEPEEIAVDPSSDTPEANDGLSVTGPDIDEVRPVPEPETESEPAADIDGDLAQLTLAQLIERFSRSLQARAEMQAAAAARDMTETAKDVRPSVGLDLGTPGYNPFSEYDDVDPDIDGPVYGSLLAQPKPARRELEPPAETAPQPVPEPVAMFPLVETRREPATPPDNNSGENSLREALRKLETLSKTA